MSRKLFTDEQMAALRQNPYVYSVTPTTLSLTKEFKEVFYAEYQNGTLPRRILEEHGFDTSALGDRRIWGISQHIRAEYAKYGEFREGYHGKRPHNTPDTTSDAGSSPGKPMTEQDQLRKLEHEVDYLRQEVEFLKKISSIRNTRK